MTAVPRSVISVFIGRYRFLIGLVIGLVAGPLLAVQFGWLASNGTVEARVSSAVSNQQAAMCAYLARQNNPDTSEMGYDERRALAREHAALPWQTKAQDDVVFACLERLGEAE